MTIKGVGWYYLFCVALGIGFGFSGLNFISILGFIVAGAILCALVVDGG